MTSTPVFDVWAMDDLLTYTPDLQPVLVRLLVALGAGFLIGLEREFAKHVVEQEEHFAGVRTYTLIALFGFLTAFLSGQYGPWAFIVPLLAFMAMVITTYVITAQAGGYGITTELAAILTFLLGAIIFQGYLLLAVIITVITTTLLTLKIPLHRFVHDLTPSEVRAFIQFVVISALVLPFLPARSFGPYDSWNLKETWTMVILVSGISLVGYLLAKILGNRKGTLLAGIIGGLVSSTAVTLNFARRSREHGNTSSALAAVSIIAASAIMLPRILLEAWVFSAALGERLLPPILLITACGLFAAFRLHGKDDRPDGAPVPLKNPLNFLVALQFALVYMAVRWLVSFASERFGDSGIYWASLVSGTTDMDAITLSMARLADEPVMQARATMAILLATLANTAVKYAIVLVIGDRTLRQRVGLGFGAMFLAGFVSILWLWLG